MFYLFVRLFYSVNVVTTIEGFGVDRFTIRQFFLGTAIITNVFLTGAGTVYSSTFLPRLQHHEEFNVTSSDERWIASLPSLTAMPGAVLGPFLILLCGRKWTNILNSTWMVFIWLMIYLSTEIWHVLFARALEGLNEGLGYSINNFVMLELAALRYKFKHVNVVTVSFTLGMLFTDLVGLACSWRTTALLLACLSFIDALIMLFLKNSHAWYLQRGKIPEAKAAYFWYRPETTQNLVMFNEEVSNYQKDKHVLSFRDLRKEWTRREFQKPLFVMIWFTATMLTSGGYEISLYSVEIMSKIPGVNMYHTVIINDVTRVAAAVLVVWLLEIAPVKLMVNTGSVMCSVCHLVLTGSLYWAHKWKGFAFVSQVSMFSYTFFYNIGYVNMWHICLEELFTGVTKPTGTAVIALCAFAMQFILATTFSILFEYLENMSYLVFAACTAIGGFGLQYILPKVDR